MNNRRKARNSIRKILREHPGFEAPKTENATSFICAYNIDTQELKIKFDTLEIKSTN